MFLFARLACYNFSMNPKSQQPAAPGGASLKKVILDILFPVSCLGCGAAETWLCKKCLPKIKIIADVVCPSCGQTGAPSGSFCVLCRTEKKSHLDGLLVAASYDNPTLKRMLHVFKYRFVTDLVKPSADLLLKSLLKSRIPVPDCLVPVPLHPRRLRWRGFNQSRLLAERISEELAPPMKIAILDVLERKKNNRPQMEIKNRPERMGNVKDIFAIRDESEKESVKNKTVLLIDDVTTTGATLKECAKVLKSAGAKKVFAAVVAG